MSLVIKPIPTASAMTRAMQFSDTGLQIEAKYIAIGKGKQTIQLDDGGRATTDTLKDPVSFLEILSAKAITQYQKQFVVDFAGVSETEFNLSEIALADQDKRLIAIYSCAPDQPALMALSPVVDKSLVAINMVLGTFPADAIKIIHQGLPLELFMTEELAMMDQAIGRMTLEQMEATNRRVIEKAQSEQEKAHYRHGIQQQFEQQNQTIQSLQRLIQQLTIQLSTHQTAQTLFNSSVDTGIGHLSLATMETINVT